MMRTLVALFICVTFCSECRGQMAPRLVGGPCEGCEAIFEYGNKELSSSDTLPDFQEEGVKMKVKGTVFKGDGRTPAGEVILYVYHTDQDGHYTPDEDASGWARRHGSIRGWVKTSSDGQYAFYTLKPGAYPDGSEPAHIHFTILEPDGKYYWLQSSHFAGDPRLKEDEASPDRPRGGYSGVLHLVREGALWVGTRNIILGMNVPGYDP